MKDQKVIDQLRLLQTVQPDTDTLRLIRHKISSQMAISKSFSLKKWFTVTPLISLTAIAVVFIFFLVVMSFPPYVLTNTFVNVKIAFAPNHYKKAKIALTNVHDQFSVLHENPSDPAKIKPLSQALALANTEMSGLQLVGEKGKYTSYQCKELYESYHKDLKKIENTLDSNKSSKGDLTISNIEQYDKEATSQLENYNNKRWIDSENK